MKRVISIFTALAVIQGVSAVVEGGLVSSASWNHDSSSIEIRLTDSNDAITSTFADSKGLLPSDELKYRKGPKAKEGLLSDRFKSLEEAAEELGGGFRFYQITRSDGRDALLAFHILKLVPGENWLSLWGSGPSLTVQDVLGLSLPVSGSPGTSSQVVTYKNMGYPFKLDALWLQGGDAKRWARKKDGRDAGDTQLPFGHGFLLIVPSSDEVEQVLLPVILEVPEVLPQITIHGKGAFNVLGNPYPSSVELHRLGIKDVGMSALAFGPNDSDEIRVMQNGPGTKSSPAVRALLDPGDGVLKFWTGGTQKMSAEALVLDPGQAFILRTTVSKEPVVWTPEHL